MKPIRTNSMFIIEFFWNSDAISNRRHGLMKGCIEYCYLPCCRKNLLCYFNTQVVGRVVKRRQRKKVSYFFFYLFINDYGVGKTFSSMYNTMTDNVNFIWIFNDTNFFIYQ